MVFQDFDQISERRRAERERKFRKKVTIGVITGFVVLVLIAAAVVAVVLNNNDNSSSKNKASGSSHDNKNNPRSPSSPSTSTNNVVKTEQVIKTMCSSTDYKDNCQESLSQAAKKHPELSEPKDFLKVAISAAHDELQKAFNKTSTFNFDSPQAKAAFEDCKVLVDTALNELNDTVSHIGAHATVAELSSKTPDLDSWLSAVISYQQTCVDGFPDGKLKTDMQNLFTSSKRLTSNSLALVAEVASFLSSFQAPSAGGSATTARHLLDTADDGIPNWVASEERRMLKANDVKVTPNVTVAKDGRGKFATITEALNAMPKTYKGRYVCVMPFACMQAYCII